MTQRVQKAIDIFLDALNEGTLAAGDCQKCAVGNLCRAAMVENKLAGCMASDWAFLFISGTKRPFYCSDMKQISRAKQLISYTEFTEEELMQIEHTFERATFIKRVHYSGFSKEEIRADQIKGLAAVVQLMLTFDEDTTTDVKEVFTSKAELISA